MIKIKNLQKSYRNHKAVNIKELNVPKGSVFGFIGSNGAGKTTTIKMLVGLLKPTCGNISIAGWDTQKNVLEAKRNIGYIADKPNLYEKLTGHEFIQFMAELYSVSKTSKELANEIEYYLNIFRMETKASDYIQSYSHGMRQKIAIIGALIHDPQLLILDEPLIGLDPQGAKTLKEIIIGLAKMNKTVFMSTHILEVAEKLCTQVGIINKGELLFQGTISELQKIKGSHSLEDIFMEMTENAKKITMDEDL